MGILGFAEAAPRLLLGAVGGVFVDRYDRLRLLTGIQFLCCLPVFGLVFLYVAGMLQFWHIAVLETVLSILRELVPEAELMNAVSLYSIGFNFARIVRPSIGGVLILWIGGGGCLVFYGVCLLFSGVELLAIRLNASARSGAEENLIEEFKEGLHYIRATPMILASVIGAYVISIFSAPTRASSPSSPKTS